MDESAKEELEDSVYQEDEPSISTSSRQPVSASANRGFFSFISGRNNDTFTSILETPGNVTAPAGLSNDPRESSFKMSSDRVALLTGSLPRKRPYPIPAQRRSIRSFMASPLSSTISPSIVSVMESIKAKLDFDENTQLPVTRSILAGMTPSKTPLSTSSSSNSSSGRRSIDWQLVTKEAEVIALKTENQRLEGIAKCAQESEEKQRIERQREKMDFESQLMQEKSRASDLEHEVNTLRSKLELANSEKEALENRMMEEADHWERKATTFELASADMRPQMVDLQEQLKTIKVQNVRQVMDLTYKIQSLESDLQTCLQEKEIYRKRVDELKAEVADTNALQIRLQQMENECMTLQQNLKELEEGKRINQLLQTELKQLSTLREENIEIKKRMEIIEASEEKKSLLHFEETEKLVMDRDAKIAQVSNLNYQVSQAQEMLASVERTNAERINQLLQQLNQSKLNEEQLNESIVTLQHQIQPLQNQIQSLQNQIQESQNQAQQLQNQLQQALSKPPPSPMAVPSPVDENLKKEHNVLKQKFADQLNTTKRLQRRLLLITKERDSCKKVIESYEHEATLPNIDLMLKDRISDLESCVNEYRNMVEQLDRDLREAKGDSSLPPLVKPEDTPRVPMVTLEEKVAAVAAANQKLNQLSDENRQLIQNIQILEENLKREKELVAVTQSKLRDLQDFVENASKRLEEAEKRAVDAEAKVQLTESNVTQAQERLSEALQRVSESEQRVCEANQKVSEAEEKIRVEQENLRRAETRVAEVEQKLSEAVLKSQEKLSEPMEVAAPAGQSSEELEKLKEIIKKSEGREKKLMNAFKTTSKEFREVVYILTGFKIDSLKSKTYALSSLYADSPDEQLIFELQPDPNRSMKLVPNEYSERIKDLIDTYVTHTESYPAFLATLTLDLFKKQTVNQTSNVTGMMMSFSS